MSFSAFAGQWNKDATQSTAAVNNKEKMVWVSRTGTKYHSNPNCSNMKDPAHRHNQMRKPLGGLPVQNAINVPVNQS